MAVISGMVIERFSNRSVSGATITIGSATTYSDSSGRFSVFVPDTGVVYVSASAPGYEPYSASINASFANSTTIFLSQRFGFL